MTSVADTRLLIALMFPSNREQGIKARDFFEKEIRKGLLAPSIILTEFIEIAGLKIGEDAARTKLNILREKGLRTSAIEVEEAIVAGTLLLCHRNMPIADALIAAFTKTGKADYVITDDPHFKTLGVKTKWF